MSWFSFLKATDSATPELATEYSPVRRKIVFPDLTDNLKIGDWLHVNISSLDVGRVFYYENGLIKNKVDQDSYLVVFESNEVNTPTYSIIIGGSEEQVYNNNLWFKSITNVNAGSKPDGNYYIYYHKDDVQYVEVSTPQYSSATPIYSATTPPSGQNYMATETGSSTSSVSLYSHEVNADATNSRISAVSFLGDPSNWFNQTSFSPGSKIIGTFSGPTLRIIGKNGPDFGIIKIKIIKTSATGGGQQIISENKEVDLYSSVQKDNQIIYTFDVRSLNLFSTYDEIYSDYLFEIEITEKRNQSSSGNKFTIEKYSYSKNYGLSFDDEEIKSDINFKSVGGLK